jgi:hypothetical protein
MQMIKETALYVHIFLIWILLHLSLTSVYIKFMCTLVRTVGVLNGSTIQNLSYDTNITRYSYDYHFFQYSYNNNNIKMTQFWKDWFYMIYILSNQIIIMYILHPTAENLNVLDLLF